MAGMQINIPEVVAEVAAAFRRYEEAVLGNDPDTLIALFWESPLTHRYGIGEILYGHTEIAAFRRAQGAAGGPEHRRLEHTIITTYGRDFAVADTEFVRTASGRRGRQSQTWVRQPEGWRIVAAHVSMMPDGGS